MTIWLRKSASILKRASPLQFGHFRYPKPDFIATDLSTEVALAARAAEAARGGGSHGGRARALRAPRARARCGGSGDPAHRARHCLPQAAGSGDTRRSSVHE